MRNVSQRHKVCLAHPFSRQWSLSFDKGNWNEGTFSMITKTAEQLAKYRSGDKMTLAEALLGSEFDEDTVRGWVTNCELRNWTLP